MIFLFFDVVAVTDTVDLVDDQRLVIIIFQQSEQLSNLIVHSCNLMIFFSFCRIRSEHTPKWAKREWE